ncbi:hypothetical protein BUALT_Bualt09G0103900 [Buddleja alternifolia]|uniref:Clp R domain-containing protein n=1 Tax=Buddleja alternifolia TaxID=168488 RepID=A0AAV6XCA1_9LAMI|nr:hypothetical protein BUALT_Bualt09G0103900 [Buddleja alternifolia]
MRAGAGCAVQQALSAEAAGVVKQAVVLAKRRGHAQVTPLHVANTMLAASSGLFRVACQQSHSHPLQCKALELCFNVALNRLPASSSNPMLGHHSQYPSISNALVAAFKRAQAHQRRGSIENQQQAILAVKIELEQLVISILDDPSVSRVMREAGFSSTQVKINVEKAVSLDLCTQSTSPPPPPSVSHKSKENEREISKSEPLIRNEDVNFIIETLSMISRKRKSVVIVGECISNLENTVKELMARVDKGGVPEGFREVKFISIPPFYSFCNLKREEVEEKMGELICLVKSLVTKGVVLYLGDLNWISDYRVKFDDQERGYYCSIEHMIMELGKLVCEIGDINGKFWLMGIATFQSYMRCRSGNNSLEAVWGLHPVTIPANTLGLSLISQSDEQIEARCRGAENGSCQQLLTNGDVKLNCCPDCSSKFEVETRSLQASVGNTNEATLSSLPPWLKDESTRLGKHDQNNNSDSIMQLCKKWNSYCNSVHKKPVTLSLDQRTLTLSSASPSSSTSCFSFDQQNPNSHQTHFQFQEPTWKNNQNHPFDVDTTLTFCSYPNSTQNSPSSSDPMDTGYIQKFNNFNAENLNILCNALEKKVPWQRDIIPEVSGTILQCRSGMLRRKEKVKSDVKEETWLFFLGPDAQAKEKISKELAKVVFGSYSNFVSIGIMSRVDYSEDYYGNKRGRDEESCSSYIERFAQSVSANPHRVFFVEDLDLVDYSSQMGIKRAIERGRINNASGEEVSLCDAIVVLSCERFRSRSRVCSPTSKQKMMENGEDGTRPLDLNVLFDDDNWVEDQAFDELGILESVDRRVVFKIQDL